MDKQTQRGWTLLQLMVGVAIVGILAAISLPNHGDYVDKVKVAQAVQDISIISLTLNDIKIDKGRLPDDLAEIGMADLRDPWDNPYQYLNIQSVKGNGKLRKDRNLVPINTDYDLYSMGPDGKTASPLTAKASRDDIIRAGDGGYIGLASEF